MVQYHAPIPIHQFHCCMHFSIGEYISIFHGALHSSQRDGSLEYFVTHSRTHLRCTKPCVPAQSHAVSNSPSESKQMRHNGVGLLSYKSGSSSSISHGS